MAQSVFGPINAAGTSGTTYVNTRNDQLSAIVSMHSGAQPPSSPVVGQRWLDTSNLTRPVVKIYDGSQWVQWAVLDTANHRMRYILDADRDSYIWSPSDGVVEFVSEGSAAMRFSGAGIALGSTTPTIALDLSSKSTALAVPSGPDNGAPTATAGRLRHSTTRSRLTVGDGTNFKAVAYTDDTLSVGANTIDAGKLKGPSGAALGNGNFGDAVTMGGDGTFRVGPASSHRYTRATPINSAAVMQWSDLPSDLEEIIVCGDFARNAAGGIQNRSVAIQLGPDSDTDGFPMFYSRDSNNFSFNTMCKFVRLYGNLWMIENSAVLTRNLGGVNSIGGGGGGGGGSGGIGSYRTINGELSSVRITYWGYQNGAWSKNENWGNTYSGQAHLLYR